MLVVMQEGAEEAHIQKVIDRLVSMGFIVHRSSGMLHTVLGGVGPVGDVDPIEFEVLPGVKECHRIVSPYKLASRHFKPAGTMVKIGNVEIGGDKWWSWPARAAWKAASRSTQVAEQVAEGGAQVLRGGAFKPRSSPYSFQGMGEDGLKMMREAADRQRAAAGQRSDGPDADPAARRVCRHPASGRAQHAELQSAARAWTVTQAGAAEARHLRHH